MRLLRFLFPILLLQPVSAFAWGATGHRVVGAIAEDHLSRKARRAVQRVLGGGSMAIAATWMDEVRSDHAYDHTRDWHWVTIPDGGNYADTGKNPNGDAIEAIESMVAQLKSDTLSPARQLFCLKVLIHLVGDLHQPLHVGRGDDRGGNSLQVQWFWKGSNLHRVWDSGLIDESGLSYTELARSIDRASKEEVRDWSRGTAADWAQENLAYRPQIYALEAGDKLDYAYQYLNWPLVQRQLLKGGVRLAGLLNAIYG